MPQSCPSVHIDALWICLFFLPPRVADLCSALDDPFRVLFAKFRPDRGSLLAMFAPSTEPLGDVTNERWNKDKIELESLYENFRGHKNDGMALDRFVITFRLSSRKLANSHSHQ